MRYLTAAALRRCSNAVLIGGHIDLLIWGLAPRAGV
jgi:hypothetical protein